jgi:organic radical activating enzyme
MDPELSVCGSGALRRLMSYRGRPYMSIVTPRETPELLKIDTPLIRFAKRHFPAVDVRLSNICNVKCRYCGIDIRGYTFSHKSEQVLELVRAARGLNVEKLIYTGGEPTIRKDLPQLIASAKECGIRHVHLNTNALMFYYREKLVELLDAGLESVGFSLDTVDADLADYIFQHSGAGRVLFAALENLFDLCKEVSCISVITKLNYKCLDDVVRYFARMNEKYGATVNLAFDFVNPENLAWDNRDEIVPSMTEVAPYVRAALRLAAGLDVNASFRGIPKCILVGMDELALDDYMYIFQLVKTENGAYEYSTLYRELMSQLSPGCDRCVHFRMCQGYHPAYSDIYGNGEFKPVIEDPRL